MTAGPCVSLPRNGVTQGTLHLGGISRRLPGWLVLKGSLCGDAASGALVYGARITAGPSVLVLAAYALVTAGRVAL